MPGERGDRDLFEFRHCEFRDRLAIAGQHGLERFDVLQFRLLFAPAAGTRSRQYITCEYIGCSTQSVPSWSKVAMRSSGGTNFGPRLSVVALTNSTMACLAGPSFHEGRSVVLGFDVGSYGRRVERAQREKPKWRMRVLKVDLHVNLEFLANKSGRPSGSRPLECHAQFVRARRNLSSPLARPSRPRACRARFQVSGACMGGNSL